MKTLANSEQKEEVNNKEVKENKSVPVLREKRK